MIKARQTSALVERITPLTDSITEVVLKPLHYVDYVAGQYLQIHLKGELLSYSIANAPLGSKTYELQIRHSRHNVLNKALFATIRAQGRLDLTLPFGDCHFNHLEPNLPILFIAGGTGFAPVKAMMEQLLADADPRAFELYWGARSQSDLYLDEKLRFWAAHVPHFTYFFFFFYISQETLVSRVIEHHQKDLLGYQFVICGPFDKSYAIREVLLAQGVSTSHLHSDAFSFLANKKG